MSSTFYIFLHEFKAGKAEKWWEAVSVAMALGGGWDYEVAVNKEKGFLTILQMQLLKLELYIVFGK